MPIRHAACWAHGRRKFFVLADVARGRGDPALAAPLALEAVRRIDAIFDAERPLIWRGPMATQALEQLLRQTNWKDLDYLIVDHMEPDHAAMIEAVLVRWPDWPERPSS